MPPHPIRWFYRLVLVVCVLVVLYLALTPMKTTPGLGYDKANHVLAFWVMAWLAEGGWPGREQAWRRYGWLICYAAFIELLQYELPQREASWFDLLADLLGLALYPALKRARPRVWPHLRTLSMRITPKR
ncbi:VanZ family protein [Caldichromatium japonicum]|uniref:VanZ family protein n=1 Tax=Caldichromatium japonicum TaxID=2699430 RepID=A0A6G7VD76_9GAMM|nr:VanZ family protein [Caldichromatium japonicum]QIK37808.1 VanZ family protein [Caldichromatium japonicum]